MKTYADKLKDPRWQRRRLEIMQRDNFRCVKCGDDKNTLQVHHKEYIMDCDPWRYDDDYLSTLCMHCHQEITDFKVSGIEEFDSIELYKTYRYESGEYLLFIFITDKIYLSIHHDDGSVTGRYMLPNFAVLGILSLIESIKDRLPEHIELPY